MAQKESSSSKIRGIGQSDLKYQSPKRKFSEINGKPWKESEKKKKKSRVPAAGIESKYGHATNDAQAANPEDSFSGFSSSDEVDDAETKHLNSKENRSSEARARPGARPGASVDYNGNAPSSNDDPNISKSREARLKKRAQTAFYKASKPHADEITRAKLLWERLRRKSNVPKDERQRLVKELMELIRGRVHVFVFKHDSVRTIQCALKYANVEQRFSIANELKGSYKDLSESRYAKFLVGKILVQCGDAARDMIVPEFYGHVRRLINHPEGSWILDDIYRTAATKEQKSILLREWYGPEFAIFRPGDKAESTADLSKILNSNPEKRIPIMSYLHERINQLVQKKMTGFTMLHDAMLQYYLNLAPGSEEASDFLRLIIGDNKEEEVDLLKNLAFTKSGSHVVCLALAYSPARDRRQILRAYKEIVEMLAYDQHGHKVLLAAYEVVDDTREVSQRIFTELIPKSKTPQTTPGETAEKVVNLATHQIGHVSLIYPFIGAQRKLLTPAIFSLIQELQIIREETSKKQAPVRQAELIATLLPSCLIAIEHGAQDLVASSFGCQFITEVLLLPSSNGATTDTSSSSDDNKQPDRSAALQAVAATARGDPSVPEHVTHSPFACKLLKALVLGGRFDRAAGQVVRVEPPLLFADALLPQVEAHFDQWALGDGGFVILALLEGEDWSGGVAGKKEKIEHVKTRLEGCRGELEALRDATAAAATANENDKESKRKATAARLLLEAMDA